MPVSSENTARRAGLQLITFALERDDDVRLNGWIRIDVHVGDTVTKIAARRGHLEDVPTILKRNKLRSARSVLRHHPRRKHDLLKLWVPREMRTDFYFHVPAGDSPPSITGGYAKLQVVDRPDRVGLSDFTGYDPIGMDVPIQFLAARAKGGAADVEQDIRLLERMAGRGNYPGTANGPPPVIRVSTTANDGRVVALIPPNYQWAKGNPNGPLWRVAGIAWDTSSAGVERNDYGNRIKQKAVVSLQQFVEVKTATRSVVSRKKGKKGKK